MRGQLFTLMITLLVLGSLLTTRMWITLDNKNPKFRRHLPKMKIAPRSTDSCKNCRENIKKALEISFKPWKKLEDNFQNFTFQLRSKCHGFDKAIITQTNTPVGSKIVYDGEKKRTLQVSPKIFSTFPKFYPARFVFRPGGGKRLLGVALALNHALRLVYDIDTLKKSARNGLSYMASLCLHRGHPFSNETRQTCAVVGNGGILANSTCGKMIDSAKFVIRCNLPPVSDGYEKHVGSKTSLVTVNPSILFERYGSLMERRRPFMDRLRSYGDAMLLLPAFSYGTNTPVSLRTLYTVEDFESPVRPVFLNPQYLDNLDVFWRSRGMKAVRLSTGVMMISLALELCDNVQVYGFWPFSSHPHNFKDLTNHYYDNKPAKKNVHAMPTEFNQLLELHTQGVLRLHLGDCEPDYYY